MTVLLVDLGNTALKWATSEDPESPHTFVHGGTGEVSDSLQQQWLALRPSRVVGCMVSSETLALALTRLLNQHRIGWDWMHSERVFKGNFTLVNRYDNFRQLGSDRWHAAIGAADLYANQALLVIHMGTATTVDTVLPCDEGLAFMGGRILPGAAMMYDSLVKGTRCRPGGIGIKSNFPKSTADAISTSIIEAHLGVIDRARQAVQQAGFEPKIVFAGGAAPLLAPYIIAEHADAVLKHNLVLRGLACRVRCETEHH